ncbi:MAG: CapA family protein, partial [Clostridia bacterium]|nr:CapA family protein [Clostridia bacterium]
MKILFTGDVNFRGIDEITYENSKEIISELLPYISSADYRIPNLETPLANKNKYKPIKKSGPNLICAPENIAFLKAFDADGVTLANNHIGDFGEEAVKDTLNLLEQNDIAYAGAGANIDEAYCAMRFEKSGIRVAVI